MKINGLQQRLVLRLTFACVFWSLHASASNITIAGLYDELFHGYDMRLPPRYNDASKDKHVDVYVNMFIVSMYGISEVTMDYSMSMFLRERWVEPRFAFKHLTNLTRLELDLSTHKDVWVPDMYILNEKNSDFHEVTVANQMMHVYPDGTIQYSMRVTGTFSCTMDLRKYPFDTQECKLEFESYSHSTENLKFIWRPDAVTVAKDIQFPQFEMNNFAPFDCDKDYFGIVYPCIGVSFVLVRSYGYYITQIYVPSLLVVLLSWVNFWLDCEAVPARISLGLLTVLTMTTQSSGARADLPRVSYVKAIDIWMATCLTFVFAALVEFAYVNVLCRKVKRRESFCISESDRCSRTGSFDLPQNGIKSQNGLNVNDLEKQRRRLNWSTFPCCRRMTGLHQARIIDKTSRILFPLAFVIFNILYWIFYFLWIPDKHTFT